MRRVTLGRWCALPCALLIALFAQEPPESARRVFSRGIFPVNPPEQAPATPAPQPALPEAPPSIQTDLVSHDVSSDASREIGQTAWRYFEKNYQPATGWFDSVRGYSYATMWDLSSGLAAVVCAEKLGIIPPKRAAEFLGPMLQKLAKIRLYNAELPNREYNTATAEMSGPKSVAGKGTGWSALDLGRLLIWLKIVESWHPELAGLAREIVQRWKFGRVAKGGEMFGVYYGGAHEYLRQEGRLGYEQYSASGYELWGQSMRRAKDYTETQPVRVLDVELAVDKRNVPFFTSEPFLLAAMELGTIDPTYTKLTRNLYRVQQRRWETTREITAASEDSLDRRHGSRISTSPTRVRHGSAAVTPVSRRAPAVSARKPALGGRPSMTTTTAAFWMPRRERWLPPMAISPEDIPTVNRTPP